MPRKTRGAKVKKTRKRSKTEVEEDDVEDETNIIETEVEEDEIAEEILVSSESPKKKVKTNSGSSSLSKESEGEEKKQEEKEEKAPIFETVYEKIERMTKFVNKSKEAVDDPSVAKALASKVFDKVFGDKLDFKNCLAIYLCGAGKVLLANGDRHWGQWDGQRGYLCDVVLLDENFSPILGSVQYRRARSGGDHVRVDSSSLEPLFDQASKRLSQEFFKEVHADEQLKELAVYRRKDLSTIPSSVTVDTRAPVRLKCGAHFTGGFFGGRCVRDLSVPYKIDQYSEYVGQGLYPQNKDAFPKAVKTTFDGIAIDGNTRVVLYSEPEFKGEILVDATGPRIISNCLWRDNHFYAKEMTATWPGDLQKRYPPHVREWSINNMHPWSHGSVKVLVNPFAPH